MQFPLTSLLTVMGLCSESTETGWSHHHWDCWGTSTSSSPSLAIHLSSTNFVLERRHREKWRWNPRREDLTYSFWWSQGEWQHTFGLSSVHEQLAVPLPVQNHWSHLSPEHEQATITYTHTHTHTHTHTSNHTTASMRTSRHLYTSQAKPWAHTTHHTAVLLLQWGVWHSGTNPCRCSCTTCPPHCDPALSAESHAQCLPPEHNIPTYIQQSWLHNRSLTWYEVTRVSFSSSGSANIEPSGSTPTTYTRTHTQTHTFTCTHIIASKVMQTHSVCMISVFLDPISVFLENYTRRHA